MHETSQRLEFRGEGEHGSEKQRIPWLAFEVRFEVAALTCCWRSMVHAIAEHVESDTFVLVAVRRAQPPAIRLWPKQHAGENDED